MDRKHAENLLTVLMKDLSPHLTRAGVPEQSYAMPTGDVPEAALHKAVAFVTKITDSPEWENVIKMRELVSEHTWANYDLYGFTGLREQRLYADALKDLRRCWNQNRPTFFGKDYRRKDAEKGSVVGDRRSEERPDVSDSDRNE